MEKLLALAIILGVGHQYLFAQSDDNYKTNNYFDVSASAASNKFSTAIAWSHMYGIGKQHRLQIGYGIRFTGFVASNKYYTTAPAKYTSTRQSVTTIFSPNIDKNIDTITTSTATTYSMNAVLYASYKFSRRWDAGFNIDVIGFSFGPERKFNVISSVYDPGQAAVQPGKPTGFNVLLTSDNDIGSLNSEFFVRYWLTEKLGLRAGYTFLFSEYRTRQKLQFDNDRISNDRYRYKAGMIMLGLTFRPFY